jgi:transposase
MKNYARFAGTIGRKQSPADTPQRSHAVVPIVSSLSSKRQKWLRASRAGFSKRALDEAGTRSLKASSVLRTKNHADIGRALARLPRREGAFRPTSRQDAFATIRSASARIFTVLGIGIESFFNKIKQCRRIATRCNKPAVNYLAFIRLVSLRLRVNESTP